MYQYLAFFLCMDGLSGNTCPNGILRTLYQWNVRSQQLLFVCSDIRVPIFMFIWVTTYACYEEIVMWQELDVVVML
jgi:hypothetical protein